MTVSGLVEFLLSRLDADERDASAIANCEYYHGVESDAEAEVQRLSDPVRVLAECAAKRALVELHRATLGAEVHQNGRWDAEAGVMVACRYWYCASCDHDRDYGFIGGPNEGCETLRILAQPYSAHPDFDPGWLT